MNTMFIITLLCFALFAKADICDSGLQYCQSSCIDCLKVWGVCGNPLCAGNCRDEFCLTGCTPSIPICDAISGLQDFYDDLSDEFNELDVVLEALTTQYAEIIDSTAEAIEKVKYLTENSVLGFFDDVEDGLKDVVSFFSDGDVLLIFSQFGSIGREFTKVIDAIGTVNFDVNILKDIESGLVQSADSIFGWILDTMLVPSAGVFTEDDADCWWEALNDGVSLSWSVGISTGPGLGLSISFQGNKPLQCFTQKIRLFSSALAKTEPEFPGLDPIIALRESIEALKNLLVAIRLGSTSDGSKPAWCNSSIFVDVDIPETPYDWVNVLTEGIEKINYIIGEDGALGVAVGAIKSIVCDAATIPTEIENWADGLLENLESRKTDVPSALVNRVFNAISNFGEKFANDLQTFETDYLESQDTGNCFLDNWAVGNITLTFTLALEIDVFPPKPANVGVGFSCLGLECWSCVTGLDSVIELVSGKRALLIKRQSAEGSGSGTIEFISGDYSNTGLNECVEYICTNGVWNENICTCDCNAANELWTPQYGCFDRHLYQAGGAPSGANPQANPNNPNYDETVDPWSDNYDSSKDKDPYYNPYELNSSTTTTLIVLTVLLALLQ